MMHDGTDGFDWDGFFVRYRPMAIRFVQGRINDLAWAEDLFQEAARAIFEKYLENPSFFAGPAHVRNYFFKSLHNLAVSALREKVRKKAANIDIESLDPSGSSAAAMDTSLTEATETKESVRKDALIKNALARLKESERESLRLRFEEGLSFREMARILGRPISTLHSRVENALKKIRKKIGKEREGP